MASKKTYTYKESIDYLYGLDGLGVCPGLKRINHILDFAENPQNKYPVILVAGTNGKGSTSSIIAQILKEAGYKVGLFTSPHIESFNERIKLNGESISNKNLANQFTYLKSTLNKSKVKSQLGHPTFFECNTFMAYNYFADEEVDIAVVEVGLGGRLDSTNVVTPLISVITSIGKDHENFLGNTIEEIALEKAGIIKKNCHTVISVTDKKALKVILEKTKSKSVLPCLLGKNFTISRLKGLYNYNDVYCSYKNLDLNLEGLYQGENLGTALMTISLLKKLNFNVNEKNIRDGLSNVFVIGRFEKLGDNIILDVAHNLLGAKSLKESLSTLYRNKNFKFVVSLMKDKDVDGFLENLISKDDFVVCTEAKVDRALKGSDLFEIASKYSNDVTQELTINKALNKHIPLLCDDDLLIVTGSFFTVSEARKFMKKHLK